MSAIGTATGTLFGALSALRGRRIFHPTGLALAGTAFADPAVPPARSLLAGHHTWPAIVRLSRGVGLPEPLPDILGFALKLPDLHGTGRDQDFLLVTSADGPLVHHLLLPGRSFLRATFSSVLFYDCAGRLILVGATGRTPAPRAARTDLDEVRDALARGPVCYDLAIAGEWERWHRVAGVVLDRELPDHEAQALRFDPWHTDESLRPAGPLNALRRAAYRGSQAGRAAR